MRQQHSSNKGPKMRDAANRKQYHQTPVKQRSDKAEKRWAVSVRRHCDGQPAPKQRESNWEPRVARHPGPSTPSPHVSAVMFPALQLGNAPLAITGVLTIGVLSSLVGCRVPSRVGMFARASQLQRGITRRTAPGDACPGGGQHSSPLMRVTKNAAAPHDAVSGVWLRGRTRVNRGPVL